MLFGWIVLLILGTVLVLPPVAIAGSGNPSGDPSGPPGLQISPYAQGTKLYGVIAVEFYPNASNSLLDAKVWLRLRKGSALELFTGEAKGISNTSPAVIQAALMNAATPGGETLSQQISTAFFGGLKTNIAVKNVDNYVDTDFLSTIDGNRVLFVVIADVELAAN